MDLLREVALWMRQLWVLWLMLLFVGIAVWTFWPGRKRELEEHGRIPLEDGSVNDNGPSHDQGRHD